MSYKVVDLLAGLLFLLLGLFVLFWLIPVGVDAPKKVKFVALHPAYYPKIVAWCLVVIGAAILVTRVITGSRAKAEIEGSAFNESASEGLASPSVSTETSTANSAANSTTNSAAISTTGSIVMLLMVAVVMAGLFFLLPLLGIPLGGCIACALFMLLAGEYRPHIIIPVAVLLPCLLYLFFSKVANIPIPSGVLEPWLLKL